VAISHDRFLAKVSRQIVRMARDRRGASAIEFTMVVPVLILMYVGAVETGNLVTIYRRASAVASTAADLTAQVKQVTNADVQDVFAASGSILTPYPATPLKIVISSVVADQNNNGKVAWSCANKGSGRAKDSSYAVPAGLTQADSSVIVSEVTYAFTPLVGLTKFFSPGAFDIKRTFYSRPRRSLTVANTDGGC
jgi:Flp pilus assembly protein TadG